MNAEIGHTPGPWRVCYDGQIDAVDGSRICTFGWDSYREFNEGNNAANARLIAAAPDSHAANIVTVAALREQFRITDDADDQWIYDELGTALSSAYFMARAAIAKATGASA